MTEIVVLHVKVLIDYPKIIVPVLLELMIYNKTIVLPVWLLV